ncbi:SMEK domain-containing protein [Pirellulaceae bacterium SH467]
MLQREVLIADIRKGLAVFQNYVRPGGTLNLTDSNVHAEDFVAGLLNSIYGWSLLSTNKVTANYPCIDLIDEQQGLGVQVTAEGGSAKLTKTVECLNANELAGRVTQLKVFLLIAKQGQYTVNAVCPGVTFDWRSDVLDFDDATKAAQAISDLQQLHRVHEHVVTSLPSLFPDYREESLPLHVPTTDPAKAWLAFSSRATRLIGRDKERVRLLEFLNSDSNFSWLLVTGDAGSGKSRLALELCCEVGEEWHAGFLSRTVKDFKWSEYQPTRKTLIVIDYVASRAAEVGEVVLNLLRASSSFTKPVRILLVEREKSSWWTTFSREDSQSESAEIIACQFGEQLALPGLSLEAILLIAKEVVHSQQGTWDDEIASAFVLRLLRSDRRGRPLFAMIVAHYLEAVEPNLLHTILKREASRRRQLLSGEPEQLKRMENLLLLATLVSGLLPKASSFSYLAASNVAGLLPDIGLLDEALYSDMASSSRGGGATLAGLQPDILGERLVLDRLSESGIAGQNARALLLAAWSFQPRDVGVVALRCVFDFQGDPSIQTLFDLPLDTAESRRYWADMVADLLPHTGDGDDTFAKKQLQKLTPIANSHPEERELQEATARADYHMALTFMFRENSVAIALFDAAIARVGSESLIGKMAIHNRAILRRHTDESYDAFEEFTMIIDSLDAHDELRACAFNNRADVYVERGEHGSAIRDRTEVLALKKTTHDRRYIALFRRSRSYSAIGDYQAALDDLSRILETWDITPHQKAEARLERAAIMRHLERWDDTRVDLEAVIASKYLFSGTRAIALVELADVSRKTGDHIRADRLLSQAVKDPDLRGETWIDAMIVGGLLLEDTNDLVGACEFWRKVLASPIATNSQLRTAQERLEAISLRDT